MLTQPVLSMRYHKSIRRTETHIVTCFIDNTLTSAFTMPKVVLSATATIKHGSEDIVKGAFRKAVQASKAEPGVETYSGR